MESFSVLDAARRYGIELTLRGLSWRGRCPVHGGSDETAFSVSADARAWHCFACGAGGSVIDLVAALEDVDIGAAIAVVAELAGVDASSPASTPERCRRQQARARREAERHQRELARRAAAAQRAVRLWEGLGRRHADGERYLQGRGLNAAVELGLVRFDGHGNVAVALRASDGRVVNVVRRRIVGRAPKVFGLKDATTRGTFGDARELARSTRPPVFVEGLADYLTAAVLWGREHPVLGAHGAGRLPLIVGGLAHLLGKCGLWLVPHADDAGRRAADSAIREAHRAGVPDTRIHVFEVGATGDLNSWHLSQPSRSAT